MDQGVPSQLHAPWCVALEHELHEPPEHMSKSENAQALCDTEVDVNRMSVGFMPEVQLVAKSVLGPRSACFLCLLVLTPCELLR